jgi:hypothetical protein
MWMVAAAATSPLVRTPVQLARFPLAVPCLLNLVSITGLVTSSVKKNHIIFSRNILLVFGCECRLRADTRLRRRRRSADRVPPKEPAMSTTPNTPARNASRPAQVTPAPGHLAGSCAKAPAGATAARPTGQDQPSSDGLGPACAALAALLPALIPALSRGNVPSGGRTALSAGRAVNPDVLHAMIILAAEIPAACAAACQVTGEPWQHRPVADQKLEPASALAEVDEQVAGLLCGTSSGRMSRDAQDVHGPGLDLHCEQHIHAPEQHGIDVQEVTRKDAGRLSSQELPPRRRRPPRRGTEPGGGEDPADRPLPTRYPRPNSSP